MNISFKKGTYSLIKKNFRFRCTTWAINIENKLTFYCKRLGETLRSRDYYYIIRRLLNNKYFTFL